MNRLSRLSALSLAIVLLLSAFLLPGYGKTDAPHTDSPTSSATTTTRVVVSSVENAGAAGRKIASMTIDVSNNRPTVDLDGSDEVKATVLSALNKREAGMVKILFCTLIKST